MPAYLESIGDYAFAYCSGLTSITVPDTVTHLGENAFRSCSGLINATLSNEISSLPLEVFHDCDNLTGINIPNGLDSIGARVFYDCDGLVSVTTPVGLSGIGESAFESCGNLTTVVLRGTAATVGTAAFQSCPNLAALSIEPGIETIGDDAFANCSSLTSVNIPGSVASIRERSFQNCSVLNSVTFAEGLYFIGHRAFYGGSGLPAVSLPDSLTSISPQVFYKCAALASITVAAHNSSYTSIEGILYNKDSAELIRCPPAWSENLTIPHGVASNESGAFRDCIALSTVTLPLSVSVIGSSAYSACNGLISMVFMGNAPRISRSPFSFSSSGFSFFFYEGATGFTTPIWYGHPCEILPTPAGTTYASWSEAAFLNSPSADPDHNGLSNLCEYAFGGDPNLNRSLSPVQMSIDDDGFLIVEFLLSDAAKDMTYTIQTYFAADGENWRNRSVFVPRGDGLPPSRTAGDGTLSMGTTLQGNGCQQVSEKIPRESASGLVRIMLEHVNAASHSDLSK